MEIKKYKPQDHKIKAVIYGSSGTGKTTFGSTAPKPIFASAEGGLLSVAEKELPYVEIKTIKDLQDLLKYLQTQKHDFESVVIDSITEINDVIKIELEKKRGRPLQLQDWQVVSKQIKDILRAFRSLPMHVIFIAQEKNITDEDKISKIVPSLNGAAATEIAYFMDIVAYIQIDGKGEHIVETLPDKKLLTKDRSKRIGNNTEADFSVWASLIAGIETGKEEVLTDYTAPEENETKKPLPQPKPKEETEKPLQKNTEEKPKEEQVPSITQSQIKKIMALWNEMWELSTELFPEEINANGNLKYTKENSEPTRKVTMNSIIGKDSTTEFTKEEASTFIEKLQSKVNDLKKQKETK